METSHTNARPLARYQSLADGLMAIGLAVFSWAQVSLRMPILGRGLPIPVPRGPGHFMRVAPTPLTYLLIAAVFLPLAVRRRHPAPVFVVVAVAAALYDWTSNPPALTIVGVLIALYTLGTLVSRRRLLLWTAAGAVMVLASSLPAPTSEMFWADVVRSLAVLMAAALLGDATRNRRAYVAEVERRAEEAERDREEETRRRIDEERLNIARELHDVTAHSLSVIAVQSGAAAHVLDTNPEEARRALVAIRATSRDALQELRAMLGVLRGSDDETAPLAPSAGLARVGDLIRPLEEAGLHVRLVTSGDFSDVGSLVDLSAYRIVQEALTNVLRHAGRPTVDVRIARDGDVLSVEVADDGTSGARGTEGHGIAGMRERATALGGTFEAGPAAGGGWHVVARLPVAGRPA